MKNLSNNSFLKIILQLLFLILIAKLIAVAILWFLPVQTQEFQESNSRASHYQSMNFKNMLEVASHKKVSKPKQREQTSIKNMILHGLYGNSDFGYAIVATKSNPKKTEIISIGEKYQGYTLKGIALNYVTFIRNNKEYILKLDSPTTKQAVVSSVSKQKVEEENGFHTVSRDEINYYIKNPTKIWKDISIQEIKKGSKIVGFKVTKVRKNSKMDTLGLKRGDIILKANGIALTSYSAAIKLYQNFKQLDSLSLLIKRGNEEKELLYEIN